MNSRAAQAIIPKFPVIEFAVSKPAPLPAQRVQLANARDKSQTAIAAKGTATTAANNKQRKVTKHDEAEAQTEEGDTAQLSSGGQHTVSDTPQGNDQNREQPKPHEQEPAAKVSESSPQESPTAVSGASPVSGDLVLAMKITSAKQDPAALAGQENEPAKSAGQNAIPQLAAATQTPLQTETAQHHEAQVPQGMMTAAVPHPATNPGESKAASTEETSKSQAPDFEAEFERARMEPVRGAHVQIAGAENQRVDIRLQERAGTLSVTVRSTDTSLTKALQDHAPELNSRLSLEHFRTELWTPNAGKNAGGRESGGGNSSAQEQNSRGRNQNGRQNGKQQQQPEWIEDFENNRKAFQKRIDYTWQ